MLTTQVLVNLILSAILIGVIFQADSHPMACLVGFLGPQGVGRSKGCKVFGTEMLASLGQFWFEKSLEMFGCLAIGWQLEVKTYRQHRLVKMVGLKHHQQEGSNNQIFREPTDPAISAGAQGIARPQSRACTILCSEKAIIRHWAADVGICWMLLLKKWKKHNNTILGMLGLW